MSADTGYRAGEELALAAARVAIREAREAITAFDLGEATYVVTLGRLIDAGALGDLALRERGWPFLWGTSAHAPHAFRGRDGTCRKCRRPAGDRIHRQDVPV